MGTKRPHSDVHPSRREQVPQTSCKRQKPDNLGAKSYKKAHPVNELKTQVRNLTRLLARTDDNLPAHIRVSKERELQTAQYELHETQAAEKKSKLIARYHKIRFFDRQKATKRLKKAQKLLGALGDDGSANATLQHQKDVEEAQVDVNYAMYYPLDKPYNSLFPKDEDDSDGTTPATLKSSAQERGDPEIRQLVKQCMVDGKLKDLRNGKLTGDAGQDAEPVVLPKKSKTSKSESSKQTKHGKQGLSASGKDDEDEESDGGFFE
ncbi:hypothetical protein AMS68_001028 [Peltaster fructicola]|uniref:rRNA-processing protein EFG1 n=1 Tax=Peltaster fructicola TaxID=286661 RepID=A0A6H0XLJ9_9PEZI|nr:hypothetical protein AMS68_001028 [Peltaster fructicola]